MAAASSGDVLKPFNTVSVDPETGGKYLVLANPTGAANAFDRAFAEKVASSRDPRGFALRESSKVNAITLLAVSWDAVKGIAALERIRVALVNDSTGKLVWKDAHDDKGISGVVLTPERLKEAYPSLVGCVHTVLKEKYGYFPSGDGAAKTYAQCMADLSGVLYVPADIRNASALSVEDKFVPFVVSADLARFIKSDRPLSAHELAAVRGRKVKMGGYYTLVSEDDPVALSSSHGRTGEDAGDPVRPQISTLFHAGVGAQGNSREEDPTLGHA